MPLLVLKRYDCVSKACTAISTHVNIESVLLSTLQPPRPPSRFLSLWSAVHLFVFCMKSDFAKVDMYRGRNHQFPGFKVINGGYWRGTGEGWGVEGWGRVVLCRSFRVFAWIRTPTWQMTSTNSTFFFSFYIVHVHVTHLKETKRKKTFCFFWISNGNFYAYFFQPW